MAVLVAAVLMIATMVPAWADGPTAGKTVTFNGNGGTVEAPPTATSGANGSVQLTKTVTPPTDSEGRTIAFIGWTEEQDEHIYMAGEKASLPTYWTSGTTKQLTKDVTLYALWGYDLDGANGADVLDDTTSRYTVTYMLNNGKGSVPSSMTVLAGNYNLATSPTPTRDGYIFLGWKASPAATPTVPADVEKVPTVVGTIETLRTNNTDSSPITISANTNIYAVWARNADGDSNPDAIENKFSAAYDLKTVATKDGIIREILNSDNSAFTSANVSPALTTPDTNIVDGSTYNLQKVKSAAGTKVKYSVTDKTENVALIGWTTNEGEAYEIYDSTLPDHFVTNNQATISADAHYYAVWGKDDDADGTPNYWEANVPDQSSSNTITVNSEYTGETFNAYRMLKLTVDNTSDPKAYAYQVDEEWADFFADSNSSVWSPLFTKNTEGYIESTAPNEPAWTYNGDLATFAEAAAEYAKTKKIGNNVGLTPDATAEVGIPTAGKAILNTTQAGYYLVTSSLGSRAMIDTTPGNVEMNEKNEKSTIEKSVFEDSTDAFQASNDAQIGDVVEFKSVAKIVPRSLNVEIQDTMDEGLDLIGTSIMVYSDAALKTEYKEATVSDKTAHGFKVTVPDSFAAKTTEDAYLYITYSAKLNNLAFDATNKTKDDQVNTVVLSCGDATTSEYTTTTTTQKITIFKHEKNVNTNLAGAIFELRKGTGDGELVKLMKIDNTNYRVADATEAVGAASSHDSGSVTPATIASGLVSDFITVSEADGGNIVIWGLDSDNDYKLKEIKAPNGYYISETVVPVTVTDGNVNLQDIENEKGSKLPTTGGMGTTVLYIVGGMMVILAGAYLFFSKRRNAA